MTEVGLSNKLFVMAQAVLETGNFKSRVCREYNNLFGLYDSRHKDYFRFENGRTLLSAIKNDSAQIQGRKLPSILEADTVCGRP